MKRLVLPLLTLFALGCPLLVPHAAPQQAGIGTIDVAVVQTGTSVPIANAQVTLSGGAITARNLRSLMETLWNTSQVPQNSFTVALRNYYTSTGMTAQAANEQIAKVQLTGIPASPDNARIENALFQGMMSHANINFGTSPFNAEFGSAIKKFRAANATFKGVTDRSGRITFRDVPAGQYTVHVERDGFFDKAGAASGVPQSGTAKVTVSAGRTGNVEVSMTRGATISGRLRDERGLPLANATVQAFAIAYANGMPSLRAAAANKTNDRGEYSIFWLTGGEYYVAMVRASTQAVGGQAPQQVVGTFYPGTTDVASAQTVAVKTGQNLEGVDFVYRLERPVRISGTIQATIPVPNPGAGGQATRQAALMLMQRESNAPDDVGARLVGAVAVDIAKGTGDFEIEVSPGSWDLFARMATPTPGVALNLSFGRTSFDVRNEPVRNLLIKVEPVPSISGALTINGSAPGQTNIKVSVQVDDSAAKMPAYDLMRRRTVPVAPDGTFLLPVVLAGHWQLFIEGLAPNMYVADVLQGGGSVFDSGMEIRAGSPAPLQVLVRDSAGTVQGVVIDSGKRPLANAQVVLVPPDSRRQNRLLYRSGTSDANGRFAIAGVAPGNYKVFAWPDSSGGVFSVPISGSYFNRTFLAKYESLGRPIAVSQAATADVEITAAPLD